MKTIDDVTPEMEQLIYEDVTVHGLTYPMVAAQYDLTVFDTMTVFDRCLGKLISRSEGRSDTYKDISTRMLFETIALAREGLKKSQLPRVKKVTKTGMTDDDGNDRVLTELHEEPHEAGDPRWLGQLLAAIKQLTDLNVLALPRQVNIDQKTQHEISLIRSAPTEALQEDADFYDAVMEGIRSGKIALDAEPKKLAAPVEESVE